MSLVIGLVILLLAGLTVFEIGKAALRGIHRH